MSDNGEKVHELVKVSIAEGKMKVEFGKHNLALIGHALRIANLQLDNLIIENIQAKEQQDIPIYGLNALKNLLKRDTNGRI